MKFLTLAMILLLCGVATGQSDPTEALKAKVKTLRNNKHYSVRHDKFRDITTVAVSFAPKGEAAPDKWTSIVQINSAGTSTYWFVWKAYSPKWRYLDNRELLALVDGNRMRLGVGSHDGEVVDVDRYSVRVREELTFRLDADEIRALGAGTDVELLIGSSPFKLKDEHKQALRDLVSLAP